jgi:hypothetical protein
MHGLGTQLKELTADDIPAMRVSVAHVSERGLCSPNLQARIAAQYAILAVQRHIAALEAESVPALEAADVALAAGGPVVGTQVEGAATVALPEPVHTEFAAIAAV